jgi:hypothetical protein
MVVLQTTMFFKDCSPSGNHGILVKHHPCKSKEFGEIKEGMMKRVEHRRKTHH